MLRLHRYVYLGVLFAASNLLMLAIASFNVPTAIFAAAVAILAFEKVSAP